MSAFFFPEAMACDTRFTMAGSYRHRIGADMIIL